MPWETSRGPGHGAMWPKGPAPDVVAIGVATVARFGCALIAFVAVSFAAHGQVPAGGRATTGPAPRSEPESAAVGEIRAASQRYIELLGRGDGPALARMWTADGDIVDESGTVRNGRESVAGLSGPAEADQNADVRVRNTAIRLVSPTVGVEDGAFDVVPAGGGPTHLGRFTATWVKDAEGWKLAGVRENRVVADAGSERLADLEWMVGEWDIVDIGSVREDGRREPAASAPRLRATVRWNATHTFLIRELRRLAADPQPGDEGQPEGDLVVTQRIGWDAASRHIHSWSFGEDGSHGEGSWHREEDSWFVRSFSVLPDGSTTDTVNVYRFDGGDACTWQSFPAGPNTHGAAPVTALMVRRKKS